MATESPATLPNGHEATLATKSSSNNLSNLAPPPPEIEATLSRLSAYRNVRGVMIVSRTGGYPVAGPGSTSGGIVQSSGSVFEGESGKRYARVVEGLVASVSVAVEEVEQGDDLKFMRIRTRRHELIITPDEKYLLVVLQDPGQ